MGAGSGAFFSMITTFFSEARVSTAARGFSMGGGALAVAAGGFTAGVDAGDGVVAAGVDVGVTAAVAAGAELTRATFVAAGAAAIAAGAVGIRICRQKYKPAGTATRAAAIGTTITHRNDERG